MNEQIKKIVVGYIDDGDYEKALSLMKATPLESDEDMALFEQCKKSYTEQCTSKIAEAVKDQNKDKAEAILVSYKKLLGEDANTKLFQTLVENIRNERETGSNPSNNISGILEDCTPNIEFLRSGRMWGVYACLAFLVFIFGCFGRPHVTLCVATIALAISLMVPILACNNNRFKPIGLILLLIPVIDCIAAFNSGIKPSVVPWLCSFAFIFIYNVILPSKSWTYRAIISILLFSFLNPLWYGLFHTKTSFFIVFSTIVTLLIYYSTFASVTLNHIENLFRKLSPYLKYVAIAIGIIFGILVMIGIGVSIKDNYDRKEAERRAIEKAHQDSIQAVQKARVAAIEKARRDSIAAVQRREQARRDSIDYVEHAGFVNKYANIGLIITDLQMTRGSKNGVRTKGIKFSVFNPTHKTIKYVIANMHAVNKFNDRMSYDQRCRGIGPVDSHDYGSWDFNDVFDDENDVIDDLMVSFTVVYTNGTSKLIRWKDAYVSDFKASWFNNR